MPKKKAVAKSKSTNAAGHPTFAYVGCFTPGSAHHNYAHGGGISVYRIDQKTGKWSLVQVCEDSKPNPGFLVLHGNQKFLYACHGSASEMSSYTIDQQTGKITPLNRQPNHGHNAVHLNIDPSNRFIVTAQGPGVEVFPINPDGSLAPSSDTVIPPEGVGRHKVVLKSHPHHVVFDPSGRYLVCPDHGADRVHVYQLDTSTGKLVVSKNPSAKSHSGAAPRHVVFHPKRPFAYVVDELDRTVTAYKWNARRGEITPMQVLQRTPPTYTANDVGSEIAITPSGNFVYASNRGHNSLAIYSVNKATGMLKTIGWESTRGELPRFFGLNRKGNYLYAANVKTDTIVIFKVNDKTGKLTATGQVVKTASPTCIAFAYF